MNQLALQDLRCVVAAVDRLRGREIRDVTVRSDRRQLKVELAGGVILVIAAERDEQGRAYLEVDVVEAHQDAGAKQQIEVHFD